MEKNEVRELLPKSCLKAFDDIVVGRSLGASNHIKMISAMYVDIAAENDEAIASEKIRIVGDFFKETRGKSSYAIVLALAKIEAKIEAGSTAYEMRVKAARDAYFNEAEEDLKKLLTYTQRLMAKMSCIMIFDYSSTVEKAVCLAEQKLVVYIPESRVINGGYPFVKGIVEAGHKVHFIPDASMLSVLDKVDAVFIGAETFYPDGTAFNTIGSDILAELCMLRHVPYYVLTPLIKGDIRARYGIYKEVLTKDLKNELAAQWPEELKERVAFESIELVGVRPECITAYVCEKGILKTSDLFSMICKEEMPC
ncbi:initiation factor 2 [Dielma fastidiosa]|uniref:initiation factor 2 n=1 Tax=Dielma fastidiosa TaxID=1034346 RepID=UPI003567B05F